MSLEDFKPILGAAGDNYINDGGLLEATLRDHVIATLAPPLSKAHRAETDEAWAPILAHYPPGDSHSVLVYARAVCNGDAVRTPPAVEAVRVLLRTLPNDVLLEALDRLHCQAYQ